MAGADHQRRRRFIQSVEHPVAECLSLRLIESFCCLLTHILLLLIPFES
jgi:hypothetical protein